MSTTSNPVFEQIEQAAENQTRFIKMQSGESLTLTFNPNKVKLVDSTYEGKTTKRVEYTVTNAGGNEKVLTLSLSWALNLNELLKRGHTRIEVVRKGSMKDTSYTFIPA
jgi:hypothetical protein